MNRVFGWVQRQGALAPFVERHVGLGIIGVMLLFLSLGGMHLLAIPHTVARDEPRHIAYAIEVASGKLPDVRDKVDLTKLHARRIRGTKMMAAAAHPPLYYAVVGLPLKWASESTSLAWGLRIARLMTLLIGAAGLLYAFLAIRLVVKERSVALAAIAFTASMPAFLNVGALVHNDTLAFLSTVALFHAVLLVLLRKATLRNCGLVVAWAAVAAASRFTSLLAVAPALTAVGLKLLFDRSDRPPVRLRKAALFSVTSLAAIAVTSGWFYLRSYRLYGDVTGGKPLLASLERNPRAPFYEHLVSPELWHILVTDLWCKLAGGVLFSGAIAMAGLIFVVAGFLGALAFTVRGWRSSGLQLTGNAPARAFLYVGFACVVVPIFEFFSRGGNLTGRYYFPVLWLVMLVVAVGYGSFRSHIVGMASLIWALVTAVWVTDLYIAEIVAPSRRMALAHALAGQGLPWPDALACALIAAACTGGAMLLLSWYRLRESELSPTTPPAETHVGD